MSQSSFVNATKRRFGRIRLSVNGSAGDDEFIIGRSEQDPFVLNDPEDPKLGWHLLKESQYCDHPLAQLHPLYWNKGVHHLENLLPFIPVPPEFVPSKALYVFEQYVYTEQRIDKFREERMPTTRPPGLALIGSPGIGELFDIHLFILTIQPYREDNVPFVLSYSRARACSAYGLLLLGPLLHLQQERCPLHRQGARIWHSMGMDNLSC